VEAPAEELEVVCDDEEAAREHKGDEGGRDDDAAGDADSDGARQ
jgi:hypothetical protein